MPQFSLPFKYEEEIKSTGLTGLAGLPLYLELLHSLRIPQSMRTKLDGGIHDKTVWKPSESVQSLILLNLAGGDHVEDIRILEADAGFCTLLEKIHTSGMTGSQRRVWRKNKERQGSGVLPSRSTVFRFLRQDGHEGSGSTSPLDEQRLTLYRLSDSNRASHRPRAGCPVKRGSPDPMLEQGKILRFWRDVEVFTIPAPPTIKDQHTPSPHSSQSRISVATYMEPKALPWLSGIPVPPEISREHTLYLAVEDTLRLAEEVLRIIVPSAELKEKDLEGITGQGCLAVFCVNQDGVPLARTYTAASFVLGAEAYRTGAGLDGLTTRLNDMQREFDERRFALKLTDDSDISHTDGQKPAAEKNPAQPYIPFTWEALREECQLLFYKLGFSAPENIKIIIKTKERRIRPDSPKDKSSQPQQELLNSFYLNDLDTLIRQCEKKTSFAQALTTYLGKASDPDSRQDVLKDSSAMLALLDPAYLPSGRWPSPSPYHLMLGQQAAVSGILSRIGGKEGGLAAVNGPPGTGKTTLLSDIIVEVVTRRAENICRYDKPGDIFDETKPCEVKNLYRLKKDVAQYTGIVVSSNNNSAVENITLNLPSLSKIDKNEHPDADYFSDVIKSVFSRSKVSAEPWGLVAGALGNSANRKQFSNAFMWGHSDKGLKGMKNILDAEYNNPSTVTAWYAAKDKFLSLKERVDARKKRWGDCYQNLQRRSRLERLRVQLQESDTLAAQLHLDEKACRTAIDAARQDAPGILSRLLGELGFRTQAYAEWKQKQKDALLALQENLRQQQQVQSQKDAVRKEQAGLDAKLAQQPLGEDKDSGPVPDELFFARPQREQHLSHIWTTDDFDLLRSRYFLAALELHEATVRACAQKFAANYSAMDTMLTSHSNFSPEVRSVLWDTLFFTVPVVSTTLASFDRLFAGMEQDSLGWLLIDEAGQATPQSVAGAVWRSHRAVIIGDPLQIEPVLTIPEQLVVHIQKKYAISDDWSPKLHSAQTLADRTMDVGAWVGSGESAVWTGLPLRAHRRCTDPMFSVSNHIAYDNQMVQANTNPSSISCCLGESTWFNVSASLSDGQVVREELEQLRYHLQSISGQWPRVSGDKDASIYIISPFRRVAAACREIVRELKLEKKIQAGTVHTFQGKEADIVFIVLGSAPGRAGAGSRGWASRKPNILNVALTRAKLLVYVIGSREDWSPCRGFDYLAKNMATCDCL